MLGVERVRLYLAETAFFIFLLACSNKKIENGLPKAQNDENDHSDTQTWLEQLILTCLCT